MKNPYKDIKSSYQMLSKCARMIDTSHGRHHLKGALEFCKLAKAVGMISTKHYKRFQDKYELKIKLLNND